MKKITLFFIALTICAPSLFATKYQIQIEAFNESANQKFGLGIVRHCLSRESWQQMDTMMISDDGKFEFDLPKGHFDLAMMHPGSERFNYSVYSTNTNETVQLKVKLDQRCIPEKIEFINIMGNFNNHQPTEIHKLVYNEKNDTYILNDSLDRSDIDKFYFNINWQKNAYTSALPITEYDVWASPSNIVSDTKQAIVFNPKEFKRGTPQPVVTANSECNEFAALSDSISNMTQFLRNNLSQLRGAESFTPFLQIREKYFSVFLELQKTYGNTYNELFFEPEYLFSTLFHPVQNELYYYSINQNSLKSQEIQESAAYITYISDKALATKKYIEQSSWLPISFYTSAISRNDDELNNYSLNNELNIPHGYFNQFLTNTVNQTNNDEIAGSILLQRAQRVSYMSPERAKILIEEIKNKYPTFSGITNGRISSIERKLIIIKGVEAPNFSVTTLDGKNFTLSDLKGKYVFLDFWGTWCGPCRSEIPNMIKMHKSLPTNSIVILGLSSGDKKDKLEKFIADNNMEYANAMCTDQILELYGVNSFPSTFLIDPQGKIVAKNLRGSNLHEMVLQQMK